MVRLKLLVEYFKVLRVFEVDGGRFGYRGRLWSSEVFDFVSWWWVEELGFEYKVFE